MSINKKFKTLCFISHEGYPRENLIDFILYGDNQKILSHFNLVGTSGTAERIKSATGLQVKSMGHGPNTGDIKIANAILDKEIDVVFFFTNALDLLPHYRDIEMLINVCTREEIPLAQNKATADLFISFRAIHITSLQSVI